jgi:hypothetical protein
LKENIRNLHFYKPHTDRFSKVSVSFKDAFAPGASNGSYSGGRDQEDCNLGNSLGDTFLKNPVIKKGLV